MGQRIVQCAECDAEILVDEPGRRVAAAYVTIGFSNGGAADALERATELVESAAADLPFRPDLARAARLLRRAASQLVPLD